MALDGGSRAEAARCSGEPGEGEGARGAAEGGSGKEGKGQRRGHGCRGEALTGVDAGSAMRRRERRRGSWDGTQRAQRAEMGQVTGREESEGGSPGTTPRRLARDDAGGSGGRGTGRGQSKGQF